MLEKLNSKTENCSYILNQMFFSFRNLKCTEDLCLKKDFKG